MKRNMKKIMMLGMIMVMVLSSTVFAYAKDAKKGNYTMTYKLYAWNESGAGALTDSNGATDVVAYVAIKSYKNNKVKNSTTGQQLAYVTATLTAKGGKKFISYHNLKDDTYRPIGGLLTLEM